MEQGVCRDRGERRGEGEGGEEVSRGVGCKEERGGGEKGCVCGEWEASWMYMHLTFRN